ncbi:sulfotransferase [Bradyrhizobium sp. 193]|uniref:sulfotransferase family protein n=1 Tax=unclassified Bradyrhizobium TaxID=2631580 RepID=UPI001FF979F4|nr:sulfotransferase [Bradyrhizobium sp. CW10]MCK1481219.1 sulfotransferase [Bradyrhizobium sp. 193]
MLAEDGAVKAAAAFLANGDVSRANAEYYRAAFEEKSGYALYQCAHLAGLGASSRSSEILALAEEWISSGSPQQRIFAHFAAGKVLLELGQSVEAFGHLNAGNASKRANFQYDVARHVSLMRKIAERTTSSRLDRLQSAVLPAPTPIFIFGMPRSGTTLIEQILSMHQEIYAGGELVEFYNILKQEVPDPTDLSVASPHQIHNTALRYAEILRRLSSTARYVTDKMPYNFLRVGFIAACFPNAKMIHCTREPLDICLSCYERYFLQGQEYTYDLVELAQFYKSYSKLSCFWSSMIGDRNLLEISYEELVRNPAVEIDRMLSFIDLKMQPQLFEFHKNPRQVLTSSAAQVRSPLYQTSTGRWRLHAAQLVSFEEALNAA